MIPPDRELDAWRALWTADLTPIEGAIDIVVRGRRRMIRRAIGEAIVGIAWIAAAIGVAAARPRPGILLLSGGIVLFVLLAWIFSIWNHAGAWRPLGESIRDCLELSAERCRRDLRAVRVGLWLSVVELVLLLAWVAWNPDAGALPGFVGRSQAWLILPVAIPIAIWTWLLRWRRRARRELAAVTEMLNTLDA